MTPSAGVLTLDRSACHFAAFVTAVATMASYTARGARLIVESDRAFCLIFDGAGPAKYEPYRAEVTSQAQHWLKEKTE